MLISNCSLIFFYTDSHVSQPKMEQRSYIFMLEKDMKGTQL